MCQQPETQPATATTDISDCQAGGIVLPKIGIKIISYNFESKGGLCRKGSFELPYNYLLCIYCYRMARSLLDQQFVQEINKNSIFGNCNPDDFITADTERKERMRKAAVERAARNKEEKLSEIKKKKQEEEDYKFACEEQERFDIIDRNSYVSTT